MNGLNAFSKDCLALLGQIRTQSLAPEDLRADALICFNKDEVRAIVTEALRAQLGRIGKAPQRGQRISTFELLNLQDPVIEELMKIPGRVEALMSADLPAEALETS